MCSMTRQHFQFIADTIKATAVMTECEKRAFAIEFADALRRTNSGFKPGRFLKACGVNEDE